MKENIRHIQRALWRSRENTAYDSFAAWYSAVLGICGTVAYNKTDNLVVSEHPKFALLEAFALSMSTKDLKDVQVTRTGRVIELDDDTAEELVTASLEMMKQLVR